MSSRTPSSGVAPPYQAYKARFNTDRASLQIPADCIASTPDYNPSCDMFAPGSWHMTWELTFTDNYYIRCRETWSCGAGKPLRRHIFTFHYGPIVRKDKNGKIIRNKKDPVVLRLDKKGGELPHLHYLNPLPH